MNRFAIGQTSSGVLVYGNDTINKTAIEDIDNEKKRARYSIVTLTMHGPNLGGSATSGGLCSTWSAIDGSTQELPNFVDYSAGTILNGKAHKMQAHYTALHPFIFLGGQIFMTMVQVPATPASYTTIYVQKFAAGSSTDPLTVVKRSVSNVHDKGLVASDTISLHTNKIIEITGGKSYFATGESLFFSISPDVNPGSASTTGLGGVSAILWLKVLHKDRTVN